MNYCYSVLFSTLAILSFCGCQKSVDTGDDIVLEGFTSLKASAEEILIPGAETLLWSEGDRIGVFASESGSNVPWVMVKDGIGAAEATFYGPKVKGSSVRAYYPFKEGLEATIDALPCDLPALQEYDPALDAIHQFIRYSDRVFATIKDKYLCFAYPYGVLKVEVQLEGEIIVKQMSLTSSAAPLAGRMIVSSDGTLSKTASSAGTVALSFPEEGVPARIDGEYTPFYFILPPGNYERLDLRLVSDRDDMLIYLKNINIPRIQSGTITLASVAVGAAGIPELNPENGYLEVL